MDGRTVAVAKPRVRYSHFAVTLAPNTGLILGRSAFIFLVDPHPVLGHVTGGNWVRTSAVQIIGEGGDFETLNTIYIRDVEREEETMEHYAANVTPAVVA